MSKGLRLAIVTILVLIALFVDLVALGVIDFGSKPAVEQATVNLTGTSAQTSSTSTATGGETKKSSSLKLRFGLDIKGGVHVVLEAFPLETASTATQKQLTPQEVDELIKVLENRVNALGLSEVVIYRDKAVPNRIIMEIPLDIKGGNLTPDDIVDLLGKPAVLEFRDPTGKQVLLTGKDLVKAYAGVDQNNSAYYAVYLEFNDEGAKKFAEITSKYLGKPIPIVLDGKVISAPVVQSVITGGKAVITGKFTLEEAKKLAALLQGGALPARVEIAEVRYVGPSIGEDALKAGIKAGILAFILVVIWMTLNYEIWGLISSIGLVVFLIMDLATLVLFQAVLTLPGIGGIILSVGMAVDGSVIIFERLREELAAGKSWRMALRRAFARSTPTILDSNASTLISALVLYWFGAPTIRGFAITLAIGTILGVFTSLMVLRSLMEMLPPRKRVQQSTTAA
ncbi:protein translocase subunit SecD [bacterium 3DAC]|jgi:preprotein translocase subunit SecD|nr:protein translocase subunit SecD [Dictyoglomota bacterium]UZN22943.1 protein translocase subunit SecD [bacterium 3DAC]